jgi:exonuclease III
MFKTKLYDNLTSWLVNIYAPNVDNSRTHLFRKLDELLTRHVGENEKIIIGGDFNVDLKNKI